MRKFWKRGDKLKIADLNRYEDGFQTLNGTLENANFNNMATFFNDMATLSNNANLNNLGDKNLIVTLSRNRTYGNVPPGITNFSALLLQFCYTANQGTNSIFQLLIVSGGSIYTRLRLINTWDDSWTQITAVPTQAGG